MLIWLPISAGGMNEEIFQIIEQEQASRHLTQLPNISDINITSWRLHQACVSWPHREPLRLHGPRLAALRDCQRRAVESSCAGLLLPQRRAVPMGKGAARGKTFWILLAGLCHTQSLLFFQNEIESNPCRYALYIYI